MFEREAEAIAARERLISEGVAPQRVSVLERARSTRGGDTASGKSPGLWASIKDMVSIPGESRASFEDHLKHGGFLVTASVPEERLEGVVAILDKSGVVDLDGSDRQQLGAGYRSGQSVDEERIPLAEEHLRVDKAEVEAGRIEVRSFAQERPVHERVHLYDYRVTVDRRSGDQGSGARLASLEDLFREQVVEMTETADEVVFEKQARVREEVVVRKEAHERVEHVDTTLRRTEVEVERFEGRQDLDLDRR